MAINRRVMEKVVKRAEGDERLLSFLRELVSFEATSTGQYTKEYERILREHALQGEEQK